MQRAVAQVAANITPTTTTNYLQTNGVFDPVTLGSYQRYAEGFGTITLACDGGVLFNAGGSIDATFPSGSFGALGCWFTPGTRQAVYTYNPKASFGFLNGYAGTTHGSLWNETSDYNTMILSANAVDALSNYPSGNISINKITAANSIVNGPQTVNGIQDKQQQRQCQWNSGNRTICPAVPRPGSEWKSRWRLCSASAWSGVLRTEQCCGACCGPSRSGGYRDVYRV